MSGIFLAKTLASAKGKSSTLAETALVRGVWENHIDKSPAVIELRKLIDKHPDLTVILGATTFRMFSDTTDMPSTVRKYRNGSYYDVYNSALQITKEKVQIYHKSKLVQGVEFIPFSSVLSKLDFLTIDLGGISGSLGTQEDRTVFAEYITDYTKNGADVFTIITNDGWWKNTPGYQQHLHYASLRAIENRREIARSANTGISAFIDVKGNVSDATQWDQQETIVKSINLYSGNTFYVVYGDYIGRVFSFLSILFLCFGIAKRRAYH